MMQRSSLLRSPMLVIGLLVAPALARCGGDEAAPDVTQCDDWSGRASDGRRAAQDAAGRDCKTDSDCEIVDYGLRCFSDCGYPSAVASSGVPALEAAIDAIDTANCDRFEAASCPGPIPLPCVVPIGELAALCESGQCTLELTQYTSDNP